MGQKFTLNRPSARKSKGTKPAERLLRLKFDVGLLLITLILIVLGVVVLFSASYYISFTSDSLNYASIIRSQLTYLGIGLLLMVVLALLDYRKWRNLALPGMALTTVLLVVVLLLGDSGRVYSRNLLGASVQPSEMAKFMIVVYLSVWLCSKQNELKHFSLGLIPLAVILGIVGGLITIQPDLSAAFTVFLLGIILFFLAGGDWLQMMAMCGITGLVGFIVVQFHPQGMQRVSDFFSSWKDPWASSEHVQKAVSALARGGLGGVGLGEGILKYRIVPYPHTDSIFSVIGEEFGFLGTTVVVILFGLLLWRGLRIAQRATDSLGALLAAGITAWITMEAFMNILALVGLMPFAGNALPFFSRGGSSLVFTLMGIGVVLSVSRLSQERETEEERSKFSALINMRGRDWRRRVSRPRGS